MSSDNGRKKVLVAMSGGVDSSVAAALLKKQDYEVEGAYMRCWSEGPYCSTDQDQADATRVSAVLGIPFQVFDFERQYRQKVLDYFFSDYEAGRTPNPDVVCNKEIKFGIFLEKALDLGFDYVATGHYARISYQKPETRDQKLGTRNQRLEVGKEDSGNWSLETGLDKDQSLAQYKLLAASDPDKDQSYFLYKLGQDQLAHTLFPLGGLTKPKVRALAKKFRLPTANKKDSTGLCFVGPVNVNELLAKKIKARGGDIVDMDGNVLGRHRGLAFYTIGQREGLGLSKSVPYYVAGKDVKANILLVVPFGHKALFRHKFSTENPDWVANQTPKLPQKVAVKLRYRAANVKATIEKGKSGVLVVLDKPQRAVTPGQSAVFYKNDEVLGGAVIDNLYN